MRALAAATLLALTLVTACAEDDEDRIDAFVSAVTGEVSDERVAHVLDTYVDLGEEPLDVRAMGDSKLYRAEDQARFRSDAERRLASLSGRKLNAVRKRIEIKGEHASVELQLLSQTAMGQVRYELVKRGKRWLIGSLHVTR
jgi:hypothetical protein